MSHSIVIAFNKIIRTSLCCYIYNIYEYTPYRIHAIDLKFAHQLNQKDLEESHESSQLRLYGDRFV